MTVPAAVGRDPVVAPVGGDESRPDDLVDGELADDGLAARRLGDRYAQHAAALHEPVAPGPGVGALVVERGDAGVGDAVDVDHECRRAECVEAHVAVAVGFDDQPVGGDRRDAGVVVEVGAGDGAGAVGRDSRRRTRRR